jgi:4-amino-4-deoxychorismate lyase
VPGEAVLWVDGTQGSALPLPDRGLDFGDGLFETLLLQGSRALHVELHLARLRRGCQTLGFPECELAVLGQLHQAAAAAGERGWPWSALRITLSRGAGPRGYAPPAEPVPRVIARLTNLGEAPSAMADPAALGLATVRWALQPALAGIKHLNRLEQVLAAREYRESGLDEAVMLDQQGAVVSVVAGNLFIVRGGELLTAPVDSCGIAGTRRELVMRRWAPALGLVVREQALTIDQLESATEVFYSNSLMGLRPVARYRRRCWESHSTCEALYRLYQGELA